MLFIMQVMLDFRVSMVFVFLQTFQVGGASWTLDPGKEAVKEHIRYLIFLPSATSHRRKKNDF